MDSTLQMTEVIAFVLRDSCFETFHKIYRKTLALDSFQSDRLYRSCFSVNLEIFSK